MFLINIVNSDRLIIFFIIFAKRLVKNKESIINNNIKFKDYAVFD